MTLAQASGVLLLPHPGASVWTSSNSDVISGNGNPCWEGEEGGNGVGPGVALEEERDVGADDMAILQLIEISRREAGRVKKNL